MRLAATALGLAAALCLPFALWGDAFMAWFTGDAAVAWIADRGAWGWLAVVALLAADLFLPVPATPVMSAAGYLWGTALGGAISAVGSFAAGMLGYGLCRACGPALARRLVGERELTDQAALFRRHGPWFVAASRWLPLLPEVVSCLAGLTRMPVRVYAAALACASVPLGFVYAAIGAAGREAPLLALGLSVAAPLLAWACLRPLLRRAEPARPPAAQDRRG